MAPKKPRLFDPDVLEPRLPKRRNPRRRLHAVDDPSEQVLLGRDGRGLVPGMADGLPGRAVKTHSARKARCVRNDLAVVATALKNQWFPIHYIELFSGPGILFNEDTGEEVPGSPLEALDVPRPFANYVFSDFSETCTKVLRARIGDRPNVNVLCGDANEVAHLERVCALVDPKALVLAYLDPAKPNLDFASVRFLAERFKHIDFLINLPFSGIHRSLAAGGRERPARMLNHPDPAQLLAHGELHAADAIREHYDEQLRSLGLGHIARRCVRTMPTNAPLYDIVLASRHPKGPELFDKANAVPKSLQLGLL